MSTDRPESPGPDPDATVAAEELVTAAGGWLTVPEVAERLGVTLAVVRRMLEDGELISLRLGPRRVQQIPAEFLGEDGPLPALRGTFTVLRDARMSDDEIIAWLFTTDATLPGGPTPLLAIRSGFKTEVRRRAMEQAL